MARELTTNVKIAGSVDGSLTSSINKLVSSMKSIKAAAGDSSATTKMAQSMKTQQKELLQLQKQYANSYLENGPNSANSQALATQIQEVSKALQENQSKFREAAQAAVQLAQGYSQTGSASGQLKSTIAQQESSLAQLKQKYMDVALAQGKDSDEARKLSNEIQQLSSELQDNRSRLSEAEQAANQFDNSLEQSSQAADSARSAFNSLKETLGNLVSAGIQKACSAIKDLATSSFSVGKDFQSGMSEVKAISGASAKDMVKLTDIAKEMGETTSFSASDAADALKYMAMAGWDTQSMLDGIEPILSLAQASALDLGTTSDIVTDALTAFGMTAQDTQHFSDVLAMTSSKANTNVALLGETFKNVAPLAGALGYTVDDVSVGLGLMANSGIKGGSAGTQLRSALANLAKPTDEVSKAMQTLGISLTDSNGEMKPFQQTLGEMRTAFSKLSEAEKSQYASTIAGKQGMSGFLAMMNASDAEVKKLTESIQNCDGAAKDMAETMTDNLNGDLAALGSKFEALQLQVFEIMEPLARLGAQTLTNSVIPAIMKTIQPMSDLILYMKAVKQQATEGGHIEEFLPKSVTTDLDTLQSRAKMLQTVMNNCKQAWSNFTKGFESSGAFQAVQQAINDVYNSVLKVSRVFSRDAASGARSFGEALGTVVKWIAQAISWFANLNASTDGLAGKLALGGLALAKFSGGFSNIIPTITGTLGKVGNLFSKTLSKLNPFKGLSRQAQSELNQTTSTTTSFTSKIAQIFQSIGEGISTAFQGIGTGISTALQGASAAISSLDLGGVVAFSVGVATVTTAFIALAACKDIVLPFLEGLSTVIGSFISGIGQTFVSLLVQLSPVAITLAQALASLSPIIEAIGMAIGLAAPAFESLGNGIAAIVASIGNAISQIVIACTPLVETLGNIFIQLTPIIAEAIATILEALGPFIPSITDLVSTVTPLVSELIEAFVKMSEQISPILESLGDLLEKFGSGLKKAFEGASEVIDSVGGAIKNTLDGLANVIESIGKSALNCGRGFDKMADGIVKITSLNLLDMAASLGAVATGATAISASSGGMEKVGTGFFQLAQGLMMIVGSAEEVKQAMADLPSIFENLNASTDQLSSIGDKIAPVTVKLSASMVQISAILTSGSNQIQSIIDSLSTGIFSAFTSLALSLQSATSIISSTMASLANSFSLIAPSTVLASSSFQSLGSTLLAFASTASSVPISIALIIASLATISPATAAAGQAMNKLATQANTTFQRILSVIRNCMSQAASAVASASSTMASTFASAMSSMLASTSILYSIAGRISAAMSAAVASVQAGVAAMQAALSVSLQGPDIKLPHISVSGSFSINPPSAPSFSVSWYKQGGILDGAQIFGQAGGNLLGGGEAGKEAVLPLSELWSQMERILTSAIQTVASPTPLFEAGRLAGDESFSLPELASGSSNFNVSYAPSITINGATGSKEALEQDLMALLQKHEIEFADFLSDLLERKKAQRYG